MTVLEWLLDADPAIRWQVLRDLVHAPAAVVAVERARVSSEGWGARLLALQGDDGQWAGGACFPARHFDQPDAAGQPWTSTLPTLHLLCELGVDPSSERVRQAVAAVSDHCRWEHAGQPFFRGEVEPCINGRTVTIGCYFNHDVSDVVARLVGEQLEDGGWNCDAERGSVRSSFATTINVLEGLLAYERATGGSAASVAARRRGQEYGGITLDQLSLVTRLIGRDFDHQDPIPGHYTLEVSSPGLERNLRTPAHFAREIGKTVNIRLRANVDGMRRIQGVLVAADDTTATVRLDDADLTERVVAIDMIDRAKTVFLWEKGEKVSQKPGSPAKKAPAKQAATTKRVAKNSPKKNVTKSSTKQSKVAAGGVKTPGPSDELDTPIEQEATA